MAVPPPDQLEELERVEHVLLARIAVAIDLLPERIALAMRRELEPVDEKKDTPAVSQSNGHPATRREQLKQRGADRPSEDELHDDEAEERSGDTVEWTPEDVEVESTNDKESAANRADREARSLGAADAPDRRALRLAILSMAVSWLAAATAVVAVIFAVFY